MRVRAWSAGRTCTLALVALAVLVFGGSSPKAQEPLKIGGFFAVTGPASFLGDPQSKTLRLYVDRINEQGGIAGRKLQLFSYDTQGDARQAISFVRRLIEDDKVDVLIGGSTTGESMAIAPMVDKAALPYFSVAGASVIVKPTKKWIFKTVASDTIAVTVLLGDAAKRGLGNVGIIAGSGGYDQSCRAEAKLAADRFMLKVVADETYAPTDTDVTPQLTRIQRAGANAVLSCGFGAPAVITVRNYRQLALPMPIYFTNGVASQEFVVSSQGAAAGSRVSVASVLVADQLADTDPQGKIAREYDTAYRAAYNTPPSGTGAPVHDALLIYADAIKRAGSLDRAAILAAVESTKGLVGLNGIYTITPTDHMGLSDGAFKLSEVTADGRWKLISK